jgi:hypothetical protein
MPERPRPDLDRVRDAMREHDQESPENTEAPETPEPEDEGDDGDT